MIEYALNAPTSILLRNLSAEAKRPQICCEMCLLNGKRVMATHVFNIKTMRYYAVCDDHYQFLLLTGGIKDMGYEPERKKDETN